MAAALRALPRIASKEETTQKKRYQSKRFLIRMTLIDTGLLLLCTRQEVQNDKRNEKEQEQQKRNERGAYPWWAHA